jgi:hypothetical protein
MVGFVLKLVGEPASLFMTTAETSSAGGDLHKMSLRPMRQRI